MTENEKYLYDHFLISIKSGFESLEDIITDAIEAVEEEGWQKEISEEWIRETLTKEYHENEKNSKLWAKDRDTEKLRSVFDSLCRQKIVALHNIGNTTSEALYDVEVLRNSLEDEDIFPIGFCFYHGQDLEKVIETEELSIDFGGTKEKNEREAIAVGNIVASELKKAGFDVKWNHSATGRILLQNFSWQNQFTSYEDVDALWGHDRVFKLME